MKYKGYIGHFTYDEDLDLFEGQVTNITDVIHFHGKSIESLRYAFQDAINEYITWCKKMRREPEKPFSLRGILISPKTPLKSHSRGF